MNQHSRTSQLSSSELLKQLHWLPIEWRIRWGCGGGCASSTENFLTFWLTIVHFGVYSDKNSQFSTLSHTFIYIRHCWGLCPTPLGYFKEH